MTTTTIRPSIIGSHYFSEALTEPGKLIANARKTLSGQRFDVIACTGISGLVFGPVLAHAMKKRLLIVRKEDDISSHSRSDIEAFVKRGDRVLLVDDFRSSGGTLSRMIEKVEEVTDYELLVVGAYLYKYNKFEVIKP